MTATTTDSAEELRHRLTDHLVRAGVLNHPSWRAAFDATPREHFVPAFSLRTANGHRTLQAGDPEYLETVYSDHSLITRRDAAGVAISSSTLPRLMAIMLEALPETDDATVLEIGTGTGYNAALLCERYGSDNVTTMDVDGDLTAAAAARLHAADYGPTVITGDGTLGHPDGAPYDAIIATCGLPRIPAAWLTQLAPDGQVVVNLGYGLATLALQDGTLSGRFLAEPAAFMTARPTAHASAPRQHADTAALMRATGTTTTVCLPCSDVAAPMAQFLGGLLHCDTVDLTLIDDAGGAAHLIQHRPSGAWARLAPQSDGTARVHCDGPEGRNLWAERLDLLADWDRAGRPAADRYGLTIDSSGTHTLWLDTADGASWTLPA